MVDRPPEYVVWFSRCIFALTSMNLRERPFLYDIMGGSLKIRFSNGCCCIGTTSSLMFL